ncbi:hypothetical protein Cadr_000019141 [Camelus dromedarius]|uniref:Uncharacterized protein n=1 Tax=Camelus dromedarius TaxID=9838 RepID=A0A5N4D442_CAMDR|nr:hypothetical protein Cadr_000019141 [Camelus dromedarius]
MLLLLPPPPRHRISGKALAQLGNSPAQRLTFPLVEGQDTDAESWTSDAHVPPRPHLEWPEQRAGGGDGGKPGDGWGRPAPGAKSRQPDHSRPREGACRMTAHPQGKSRKKSLIDPSAKLLPTQEGLSLGPGGIKRTAGREAKPLCLIRDPAGPLHNSRVRLSHDVVRPRPGQGGMNSLLSRYLVSPGSSRPPLSLSWYLPILQGGVRDLDPVIRRSLKPPWCARCPPHHNHKLGTEFLPLQDGVFLPSQGRRGSQDRLRALPPHVQVGETREYQPPYLMPDSPWPVEDGNTKGGALIPSLVWSQYPSCPMSTGIPTPGSAIYTPRNTPPKPLLPRCARAGRAERPEAQTPGVHLLPVFPASCSPLANKLQRIEEVERLGPESQHPDCNNGSFKHQEKRQTQTGAQGEQNRVREGTGNRGRVTETRRGRATERDFSKTKTCFFSATFNSTCQEKGVGNLCPRTGAGAQAWQRDPYLPNAIQRARPSPGFSDPWGFICVQGEGRSPDQE